MMDLSLNDVQHEVVRTSRTFLARELGSTRRRALAHVAEPRAIDAGTWRDCLALGWISLAIGDDVGGVGLGLPEEVLLARELGRAVAPGPFLPTMIAVFLLDDLGEAALRDEVLSGDTCAGFAVGDLAIDVADGDLVIRSTRASTAVERLRATSAVPGVDPNGRVCRIATSVPCADHPGSTGADRSMTLLAAHLLGVIEAARDASAAYACERVQFGRPIGSFQAVKHRCADMAVQAYAVRAQVFTAATLLAAGHPDAAFHAAAALDLAIRASRTVTADNIQNHGGIGYTEEHDCHHLLKRALVVERIVDRAAIRALLLGAGPTDSSIPSGARVGPPIGTTG